MHEVIQKSSKITLLDVIDHLLQTGREDDSIEDVFVTARDIIFQPSNDAAYQIKSFI